MDATVKETERPGRLRIALLDPGVKEEGVIWGERICARSQAKYLLREFPGSQVFAFDRSDLAQIRRTKIDLLISTYTGPVPDWRVDDIAEIVEGITLLYVVNHADLLEEFARIPVDGFMTNSAAATAILGRNRPAVYIPLGIDDDFGPVEPVEKYRADVVFLGSGGRGNKQPATTRHYLDPAKNFDFALWGSYWDREYWEPVYRRQPEANNWHRFWRGPLPLDDIAKLYSSAKIVLNYHEDSQRKWGMWNNRIYEALGCGALLITDDALGLREEFGDAVVITAGGAETARLITHFLAHSDERRRIGSLGREIVRQRYVYSQWARAVREFYQRLLATRHHLEGHRDGASHQGRGHRPKFTVLMPVFERILGMREAIDSVLGQTLADWELIIADDGSRSPEVQRIVDAYRETPGVYVIRLPHRCQGAALNAAARLARGDYLCRLDSDDLLVPEALEILNGYIERYPEVGYFYSSRYVIDEAGDIIERHHKSIPFDSALLLKRYIANPLLCWKRQDFMAVGGFREEVKYAEDYDLALRMACRFRFQNIEEFLYQVRYHSGRRLSTSFSPEELRLAEAEVRATSGEALRAALAMRNRRSNE